MTMREDFEKWLYSIDIVEYSEALEAWQAGVKYERAKCAAICREQAELLRKHHIPMATGAHACEMLILARDEGVE